MYNVSASVWYDLVELYTCNYVNKFTCTLLPSSVWYNMVSWFSLVKLYMTLCGVTCLSCTQLSVAWLGWTTHNSLWRDMVELHTTFVLCNFVVLFMTVPLLYGMTWFSITQLFVWCDFVELYTALYGIFWFSCIQLWVVCLCWDVHNYLYMVTW